jgi:hypothetical protein
MRQTRKRLKAKNRKKISHTTKGGGGLGWFGNPVTRTKEMGKEWAASKTSKLIMNYLINPNDNNPDGMEQLQKTLATLFNNIEKWWNALPEYPIQSDLAAEDLHQEQRRQSKRKNLLFLLYIFKNLLMDSYPLTDLRAVEQLLARGDLTSDDSSPDIQLATSLTNNMDMVAKNLLDAMGDGWAQKEMQIELRTVYPLCDADLRVQLEAANAEIKRLRESLRENTITCV